MVICPTGMGEIEHPTSYSATTRTVGELNDVGNRRRGPRGSLFRGPAVFSRSPRRRRLSSAHCAHRLIACIPTTDLDLCRADPDLASNKIEMSSSVGSHGQRGA